MPDHEGRNQAKEGWFQKGSSGTYVQPVATSSLTGKPTITVATPLFDRSGQRIGIVAANLNLERLDRIVLPATGLGKTGASYLVGKNGHFVHEAMDTGTFAAGVSSTGIDRAIAGNAGRGLYDNYHGVPVIGSYRWLDEVGAGLVAEQDQHAAFAPARTLAVTIGGVGLLVAGLLAIGTYLASRRIARPILAITDTAQAVAAGDLDREAPVTTNDEVGALAVAFNTMTGRLRETLEGLELRVAERTDELAKQNVELEALNETSVGIMQRLDLDELLLELVNRAGEMLGTPHGYVYLAAAGADEIENRIATGLFESDRGRRMRAGVGVAGQVWATGESVVVDDYDAWSAQRSRDRARLDREPRRRSAAVGRGDGRRARDRPRPLPTRGRSRRRRSTCSSASPSWPRSRSTTPVSSPRRRTPARSPTTPTPRRASSSRP